MNLTSRIINFFSLDGTVKYWTPDGINNKQKITSYEMIEDNSFIKVKESGLYMIYSQVKKNRCRLITFRRSLFFKNRFEWKFYVKLLLCRKIVPLFPCKR